MTPKDYEIYVAQLIGELSLFKGVTLSRNRRYSGIRQPGEYEVDISLEFTLGSILSFLVIVECKNWSRPVDRPAVQKLAQTQEAIGANKGVIVSPHGFTKEAVQVAKVLGVDLWVATKSRGLVTLILDMCLSGSAEQTVSFSYFGFKEIRLECLRSLISEGGLNRGVYKFSYYFDPDYFAWHHDEKPAAICLAEEILRAVASCSEIPLQLIGWWARARNRLLAAGVQKSLVPFALRAVLQGDEKHFRSIVPSLNEFPAFKTKFIARPANLSRSIAKREGLVNVRRFLLYGEHVRHPVRRYRGARGRGS
jgi:hypothetical protein